MPLASINELHIWTGKTRATVAKALDGMPFEDGPKGGKQYDTTRALPAIYGIATGESISPQEAARQLTIARKQEIELNMEVTRKERVRIEDVKAAWEEVKSNIAGILRGHRGKVLDDQCLEDLFAELRRPLNASGTSIT